jgi:heavy metal translocating P-type ATPase
MREGRIKALHESYFPLKIVYLLFVVGLWFVPDLFEVTHYWIYIPILLLFLPTVYEALEKLYAKQMSSELFMSIATVIALLGGEQSAIFVVLIILFVAHYVDALIKKRTEDALSSLIELMPREVLIKKEFQEIFVPLSQVKPGMVVVIKTGERIPVDGTIVSGEATIQESFLTGESLPLEKLTGDIAFAGTYVEEGSIDIIVVRVGQDTLFGKIRTLIDQSGQHKAHIVGLADRITRIFTPLFLLFIALVWLVTGNARMVITLLIFGSPLELTLVTPLTMLAAIVAAFKRGILVKSGAALESLAYTDTLIFDKTGTLTMGFPEVVSLTSLDNAYEKKDILRLVAIAEKKSGHILAKSIMREAAQAGIEVPDPEKYVSLTGHGITMSYQGTIYYVGNRHFIEAPEHAHVMIPQSSIPEQSLTTFYVATEAQVLGVVCLADRIKPDARQALDALKIRGLQSFILLSGDKQSVAQQVADQLGIAQAYGEVMPDEKLALLKKLQENGHQVTMVGDGINDAPALKEAHVGIAIGSMGMEPAIQAADIVLMSDKLDQIVFLYDLSCEAMRTIKQNLLLGFALTHTIGIILALFSIVNPIQAALFHAVPDIFILLRAMRLINFRGKQSTLKEL